MCDAGLGLPICVSLPLALSLLARGAACAGRPRRPRGASPLLPRELLLGPPPVERRTPHEQRSPVALPDIQLVLRGGQPLGARRLLTPVSYTHLTLPTKA